MHSEVIAVTCCAPVNIAVIKYWGKRDQTMILPLNDSLSGTLCSSQMRATTTVAMSPNFQNDRIWLNGKEEDINSGRFKKCLQEARKRALIENTIGEKCAEWKLHVCSENNFPTAAGLASSAAGYACLAFALTKLYNLSSDVSTLARLGSGSACRSVYGGFVAWQSGLDPTGADSVAKQIAPPDHWPEMRVLILVVNEGKKKVGSTVGMQDSVRTSELLKYRVSHCVAKNMEKMIKAIKEKRFHDFAEVTMKDSNQLHSICLDTYPPCVYMSDVSHAIASMVHVINTDAQENIVCYTFDAGPNACLYVLEENVNVVIKCIQHWFPTTRKTNDYFQGMEIPSCSEQKEQEIEKRCRGTFSNTSWKSDALKYIMYTRVGDGPRLLEKSSLSSGTHLLNSNGVPKHFSSI